MVSDLTIAEFIIDKMLLVPVVY